MTSRDAPTPEPVPGAVRALLRERIESYEELEVVLALERARRQEKTAEELGEALHLEVVRVDDALRALEAHELVAAAGATHGTSRWRYRPATAALDGAVRALGTLYAEQPISIIKLMSEHAIQRVRVNAVRAFADAFILGKDKKHKDG